MNITPRCYKPRIVVTGLGMVTALGNTVAKTWQKVTEGCQGVGQITAWDTQSYPIKIAAQIKNDVAALLQTQQVTVRDRCHQLALLATQEAVADARLNKAKFAREKYGVAVGTSLAGMVSMQNYDQDWVAKQKGKITALYDQPMHVCADLIAKEFDFAGPRVVVSTACTASTIAIAQAMMLLRAGQVDCMLVCGCDPLAYFSFCGFTSMRNVAAQPCSPFSEQTGLSLGEGAGVLVLEQLSSAQQRNATIYAELIDCALTSDAYHPTSPEPTGKNQRRLILTALSRSQVAIEEVDYINAHGTGTQGNDAIESMAIAEVVANKNNTIAVSSIKGALGHTLGAAGAIEAVLTIKAIAEGSVPPTANFVSNRAHCQLNYTPNKAVPKDINIAITENFAFGGNNAAVVLGNYRRHNIRSILNMDKRVVITGIGMTTPLGHESQQVFDHINRGVTAIDQYISSEGGHYLTALLGDFSRACAINTDIRRADRLSQMIVVASALAAKDARLKINRHNADRIGIVVGTMSGHASTNLQFHREILSVGPAKVNPILFPNTVLNAGAGLASINLQAKGCNVALSQGQASGLCALTCAYELIKDDMADVVIAGGADEINDYLLSCYAAAGLIRTSNKSGRKLMTDKIILGEGAGFVVLESHSSAQQRNASIYGELLGYNQNGDTSVKVNNDHVQQLIRHCIENASSKARKPLTEINEIVLANHHYQQHYRAEQKVISQLFVDKTLNTYRMNDYFGVSAATNVIGLGLLLTANKAVPAKPTKNYLINSASIGGANISVIVANNFSQ